MTRLAEQLGCSGSRSRTRWLPGLACTGLVAVAAATALLLVVSPAPAAVVIR
ncbi:hypothetical protein ACLFMI_14360 [Pseudonocardia nantongensis]|uniref:hypothetical protein n=1 Tax=Pseudonocardia nantongensis TaxID=1181885 RepID=UPI003979E519